MSAELDEADVLRVTAMIDAIQDAGLTTEAEMFSDVYWGWLRIAQAYVCAHPYVEKPELGGMTPISALGVVDSGFGFWSAKIPGTPRLNDARIRREAVADDLWHRAEDRRMRIEAGEEL